MTSDQLRVIETRLVAASSFFLKSVSVRPPFSVIVSVSLGLTELSLMSVSSATCDRL